MLLNLIYSLELERLSTTFNGNSLLSVYLTSPSLSPINLSPSNEMPFSENSTVARFILVSFNLKTNLFKYASIYQPLPIL